MGACQPSLATPQHTKLTFSIRSGSLPQVANGPDDREKYRATADDVDEVQDVVPSEPPLGPWCSLFHHHQRDVIEHLKSKHDSDYLLFALGQVRLRAVRRVWSREGRS